MSLKAGDRLGPYQIDAPIGAGGMGEVYRARDTRLNRVVAIKLILGHVAADPQFKERFDREAKAISALDHPNICTLYDVGQDGDTSYLVMQYLEGETLADRLARAARSKSDPTKPPSGGATAAVTGELSPSSTSASRGPLPIDMCLRYGAEIASALDVAHQHGIVHRDLKPGNVMITKTGTKLLDFGLAKLAEQGGTSVADIATRQAPLTGQGSFIGTLHYMSPEQLEARAVDARSDTFSFGVVLYEMLTGRRAFDGTSQAGVIAAIIGNDAPSLGEIADTRTPVPTAARRALERLLHRCLAKDPDERWHSAADLAAELRWINEERQRVADPDAALATPAAPASRARERMWMAATGAALLVAGGLAYWLWPRPAPPAESIRFTVSDPPKFELANGPGFLAISPDGRQIAFVTGAGSEARLWIRSLGSLTAQMLPGTDSAWQPTWSPDGKSLLFTAGAAGAAPLKRVDLSGGPATTIAPASQGRAAWGHAGVVLFSGEDRRLYQVPERGGQVKPVTELDKSRGETSHEWPVFLPDGRRFVFCAASGDPAKTALFLASLDAPGRTHLVDVESSVEYGDGYLFYQRDGTVMAQALDEKTGHLSGDPVPAMENIQFNGANGRAAFSVSETTGTLVFRSGGDLAGQTTLTWFDAQGKVVGTVGGPAKNGASARLSADRTRVVVPRSDGRQNDLWVIDTDRPVPSRITFGAGNDTAAIWSDDTHVVFRSIRNGQTGLYRRVTSGPGADEPLIESNEDKYPDSVSPDGKILFFERNMGGGKGWDLWALPLTGDHKPYPVLETPFNERGAALSPDGHWLAYYSDKAKSFEIYVQSYPTPTLERRISMATGYWPAWSPDGSRIYFKTNDHHFMMAPVTVSGGVLNPGALKDLFVQKSSVPGHFFGFDPVGPRFLLPMSPDAELTATSLPITVITNWTKTIKNR